VEDEGGETGVMKIRYTKKGKEYVRTLKKCVLELNNGDLIELWSHGNTLQMRSANEGAKQLAFLPIFPWSVSIGCQKSVSKEYKGEEEQAEMFFPQRRRRR
jgi:hypothetical protein